MSPEETLRLADLDAAAFYVDGAGARAALEQRRQFNAIDTQSASKVDLIVRKERPYSLEELARRQYVDLSFDRPVAMVTPEDAILSKLEWAQRSGDSVRQLRDAAGVLELNPGVDRTYIERWAIEQTLQLTSGNREEAARILDIGARTLYRKLEKYQSDDDGGKQELATEE